MNKKILIWICAAAAILLVTAVLIFDRNGDSRSTEAPPLAGAAIGGAFNLTDHLGRPFSDRDLKGRYALIYFGYTYCPDVCPMDVQRLMQGFKAFEKQAPERAAKVQLLFVTVDPDRDTPEALKQFVTAFHPRLIGLTGDSTAVASALKAYRVYARRAGPEDTENYLMDHSANAFLFSPDGNPMLLFARDDPAQAITAQLDRWVR